MAVDASVLDRELSGLDALDVHVPSTPPWWSTLWSSTWPKVAAVGLAVVAWQVVVWTHWRPSYVLPGPGRVFSQFGHQLGDATFRRAIGVTLQRAVEGYALAIVVGLLVGAAVARVKPLRTAVGSLITGLQTMPSIAWFPLAIMLFKLSEAAILFVVVIGAAPSIANGFISGVDHVPPLLVRAGRVLGARGVSLYRHVILPAALPTLVSGLKQGWAFAWRSLMAGELLVIIAKKPSIGSRLDYARQFSDGPALLATMLVILVIGAVVDAVFTQADARLRRRWGLLEQS
jgi:NitT/TauT family transport system permease protein